MRSCQLPDHDNEFCGTRRQIDPQGRLLRLPSGGVDGLHLDYEEIWYEKGDTVLYEIYARMFKKQKKSPPDLGVGVK